MKSMCTISIVSHGDEASVLQMLSRSKTVIDSDNVEIIIRENKEKRCDGFEDLAEKNKNVKVFYNQRVLGFGVNHNLNFRSGRADSKFFIVCNPDLLSIPEVTCLDDVSDEYFFASPVVRELDGSVADFRRGDIGFVSLAKRFLNRSSNEGVEMSETSWVPSIFKIFTRELYEKLHGYDERIFMYYEDYDICMRGSLHANLTIISDIEVWHEGRRTSRKSLKLFLRHLSSILYVKLKHRG